MDVKIRCANVSDAGYIAALSGQLDYPTSQEAVSIWLQRFLNHEDHAVFVAEVGQNIVGWVHAYKTYYLYEPVFAEIGGIVVDSNHRGTSVAQQLMQSCEEWAKNNGCAYVRARSGSTRLRAHAFYTKIGYEQSKTQKVFTKYLI